MNALVDIIALFAGIMGLSFGLANTFAYRKLICHLKDTNVIDENYDAQ